MKLKATIIESVKSSDKSIIVEFEGDEKKQHFEVICLFSPFYLEMKKWNVWLLHLKMESKIDIDPITGEKNYFTYLLCKKADLISLQHRKDQQ